MDEKVKRRYALLRVVTHVQRCLQAAIAAITIGAPISIHKGLEPSAQLDLYTMADQLVRDSS